MSNTERIIDVAQYLFDEYKQMSGTIIDEMKLHKLLYFAQRESLAITNKPLFSDELEGWEHGPVSRTVRNCYSPEGINCESIREITPESMYIAKSTLYQYGEYESWSLRRMTHKEISWINARSGLSAGDRGNKPLSIEDIREDAKKIIPYDPLYDMYYDEFDDFDDWV